jgi:6,7-dimethyl-8-ribityllumazine synthase
MVRILEGQLNASGLRFGVVVSRFNSAVADRLVEGALDCLMRHGAREGTSRSSRCPGPGSCP